MRVCVPVVVMLLQSLASLPTPAAAQVVDGLVIRPVRSYRTDSDGQTRVQTLIQIPLAFMEPAGADLTYDVTLKVADQAGVALHTDQWRTHAPAAARAPGAYGISVVNFAVAPGAYKIDVQVTDSVSGKRLETSAPMEGYTARPEASDLMLASAMRVATAEDSVPRPGEMRRGNTLFSAAALLRLTTLRTDAFYILEAYNEGVEQNGTIEVAVLDESGKAMLQTPPTAVRIAAGGGLLKGKVDLAGLPPGSYIMRLQLTVNGKTIERTASLAMAPLEETLQRDVARIDSERITDEGYFKYMDVAGLDSAFGPLRYIADPSELKVWNKNLSEDARRRFLTEFWQKRDDVPGGPNKARENFYQAIEFANRTYWEKKTPGWKTDRGRVYARWGAPDELLHREQEARAPAYEVWKYARSGRYYIFADLTGIDNWKIMYSNDLKEVKQPDWRERLTEEGVRDAGRFLNVDFYSQSQMGSPY